MRFKWDSQKAKASSPCLQRKRKRNPHH